MDSRRQSPPNSKPVGPAPGSRLRLQKYLADCGVASRRACEEIIAAGRVTVDGETVSVQGIQVDPSMQTVAVDGEVVRPQSKLYLAFHKPRNVICSSNDPEGRPTFIEYLPDISSRVYSVGRLDFDSEGLLVVTNDGSFAQSLSHPRHEVHKTYQVWADRAVSSQEAQRMLKGVTSRGERLRALGIKELRRSREGVLYEVVLGEGRNRHIRRMFDALGLTVLRLRRTEIGSLSLGDLEPGTWRHLSEKEIAQLLEDSRPAEGAGG